MFWVGALWSEVSFGLLMSRQSQQPENDQQAPQPSSRRRRAERRRVLGVALSLATHALVVALLLFTPAAPPPVLEPPPIAVELISEPPQVPAPAPPAPKPPAPAKRAARKTVAKPVPTKPAPVKTVVVRRALARPKPAPRNVETLDADEAPEGGINAELSDAQLAGAADAGSGGGGGGACDMAGRVQAVLRKDRLVHSAVAGYTGKAIMVWDGEWVWMRGDIGRGLTAVRQAIAFEVAFAPEACRATPMHGMVVFSLNGAQGPVRLAVGSGNWRWTDLLAPRGVTLRR
jgi:hypothetical protein